MRCKAVRLIYWAQHLRWTQVPCTRKGLHIKHKDADGVTWYGKVGN